MAPRLRLRRYSDARLYVALRYTSDHEIFCQRAENRPFARHADVQSGPKPATSSWHLSCSTDCMESNDLRFLDAHYVETPAGPLNGFSLVSPSDAPLGIVDGVLIDPAQRQVRYYVVKPAAWLRSQRYLLPATPVRLEAERRTLHVDVEPAELANCPEADLQSFTKFSAEDALAAMFSKRRVA